MSRPREAEPVKLIMSLFAVDRDVLRNILTCLIETYGGTDFVSGLLSFEYTSYYAAEMGPSLLRRFVSFERLIRPESLPDVKNLTNGLEDRFAVAGQRTVNIDPGYIAKAHLILATGKGYTHRPYLRDGIYADLTLMYSHKTFSTLPWTYPDYAEKSSIEMFNKIRARYVDQLRNREN
ncbi:protein of unknown function [Syntrophus gentianae]|uniref:GTP-binding protein n=1 Tax=Syntrophus gentianae TaxID=43775 RepID=A0A1H7UUS6_9BACT|nr:DUF4416 family protein [Syntrophus gentianae]SEM00435.1 protein of unknown function [Syntrophus gentianae]